MNAATILLSLGTLLAIGLYVWYTIRKSGRDEAALGAEVAANEEKAKKIKTLDDLIVDSEYQRRIEEKKESAKVINIDDARRMLEDATRDDPSHN